MFFNRDKYRITLTGDEYDLIIKCLIDLRIILFLKVDIQMQ